MISAALSPLAAAGGRYHFASKELERVSIDEPYERYDGARGKYLEAVPIVLKEGTNGQYQDREYAFTVACEVRDGYLKEQDDLPWVKEMLNEFQLTQVLMEAAQANPDKDKVMVRVYQEDYDAYLAQKEKLSGAASEPQAICEVGGYYYGFGLKDASAEQTEAVVVFADGDGYMAYMIATENKEKWDQVKANARDFVNRTNAFYPGRINPDKVLVCIMEKELSYFVISDAGYEVNAEWPSMAQDGYCFALSDTAVRTFYDLAGARNILCDADAVAHQVDAFAAAQGSPLDRIMGQVAAELEVHAGGWLITEEGSSWHRRAMPADINLEASPFFIDCVIDAS